MGVRGGVQRFSAYGLETDMQLRMLSFAGACGRLLLLALLAACSQPPAVTVQPLAPGEWHVAARMPEGILLVRSPRTTGAAAGVQERMEPGRAGIGPGSALLLTAGATPVPLDPSLRLLPLPPGPASDATGATVTLGQVDHAGRSVLFPVPSVSPSITWFPARPNEAVFESGGTLWVLDSSGSISRAAADRVGGFDRESLAARQREGLVILYWAAVPVPDANGELIAFATNREAVQDGRSGQSIWLVERGSDAEYPLVYQPGRSFRPVGWLGGELLFIGDEPGVFAIEPRSQRIRTLASGTLLDISPDASGAIVADGLPHDPVLTILRGGAERRLPAAPEGLLYAPQAALSPSGARALVQLGDPTGEDRRFAYWNSGGGVIQELPIDARTIADWPTWLDDSTLLARAQVDGEPASFLVRLSR